MKHASRLCLCLLVLAALVRAEGKPDRIAVDPETLIGPKLWYGIYMHGKKVGFAGTEWRKANGAQGPSYEFVLSFEMKAVVLGQPIDSIMRQVTRFEARAPYRMVYSEEVNQTGPVTLRKTLHAAKVLKVVIDDGREQRTMEAPLPDYVLADEAAQFVWFRTPRKVGDTLRVRTYDSDDFKEDVDSFEVTEVKRALANGVATTIYVCKVSSAREGEMGIARFSGDGTMLTAVLGGVIEIRYEPKEVAQKLERGGDLFLLGVAKIDRPIGNPTAVTELVLEVSGAGAKHLKAGPRQAVEKSADGTRATLKLGAAFCARVEVTKEEIAENLKETVDFPVRSEKVVAMAKQAVAGATSDREKVDRLVRFVGDYVADVLMPYEVSVSRVIEDKQGDCTEHAALFATLARAAGVPARVVTGLMYVGDDGLAFGGHAWNEVVLNDRWVPVDPAWNQTEIDATHIRTDDSKGYDDIWTMGRLRFKLVSVKTAAPAASTPR
ncbi:MAG: transglutaminase-like domain-containing protein [Planctomycetota bacterium]|nr:transglutaminase-like domain-containing protein [Planctomycetota bacterium]